MYEIGVDHQKTRLLREVAYFNMKDIDNKARHLRSSSKEDCHIRGQ